MRRILTALVLLLVAGVAFAQDGDSIGAAKSFAAGLTPPPTDYSIAYLSQIFGTVGNVLQGTSGQVLGKMFAIFNKGVLVVAALWLCMTTVQMVLRAATEGSFMGQNKAVHMILLRIALGFGLIIPSSATGYSVLQDLFMKIVVESVALADQTWDAALDYIQYGGNLYIPPSNLKTDSDFISTAIGSSFTNNFIPPDKTTIIQPVTQIFQDEVCMIKSSSKSWQPIKGSQTDGSGYSPKFMPGYDYPSGRINFPGVGDVSSNINSNGCGSALSRFCRAAARKEGECASFAAKNPAYNAEFDYSYSALKQLVNALLPVAESYVQHQDEKASSGASSSSADSQEADKTFAKGIMVGMLGYVNLITPYQNLLNQGGIASDVAVLSTAEAQGWIMAGAFYWNIEQANNISTTINLSNLLPHVTPPTAGVFSKEPTYLFRAANQVVTVYGNYIKDLWAEYVGAQQNIISSNIPSKSDGGGGASDAFFGMAVEKMGTSSFTYGTGINYNPIVTLMDEGTKLLNIVVSIWMGAIALTTILAIPAGFCNSTSPGGLIFKTALSWIKSIMMIITGALLVPGAIMAYYVPMYPFAVFTFAVVGWFGMVLEGMAAAPLVCLGMTHPEGHDFLGKAEQALMLFLSIFLRPALMVIGVIAFMVISFVAFEMFITAYQTLMGNWGTGAGAISEASGGLLTLITQTMIMVIFGFMTMELIEQSAKLIYQVPNNINRWIGAPGMGEEYGQMAGALKGAVSSGAEQSGKGAELGLESGSSAGQIGGAGRAYQKGEFGKGGIKDKEGPPSGGGDVQSAPPPASK